MDLKRFWLACLAVYVVYQVLGFLIREVWLGDTYLSLAHVWRPALELSSNQWIMFVTSAVFSIFFCYIFARGYEGRGVTEGARFGAIIGLFYSLPQAYDTYALIPIPYSLALKWFLSGLVICVILGVVAALIYKPAE